VALPIRPAANAIRWANCFREVSDGATSIMQFLKTIAFATIGLIVGLAIFILVDGGYFERWKQVSPPPPNIVRYFSVSEAQEQSMSKGIVKVTRPCDYSAPEFSLLSNSPKRIVDCFQESIEYAGTYYQNTSVLDSDGNVWDWHLFRIGLDYLGSLICLPGLGLLTGLFIAFLSEKLPNQEQSASMT